MIDVAKNFAKGTVSQGYDASATSIALNSGHGARFPAVPFNATWWNATDYFDPADDPNVEIVRVTNIATDTLTVTRGQEGISASTKNTSNKTYKLSASVTAKLFNDDLAPSLLHSNPSLGIFYDWDDFVQGAYNMSLDTKYAWNPVGSGGISNKVYLQSEANHPGIAQMQSDSAINGYYGASLKNYSPGAHAFARHDNIAGWEHHYIFRLPDVTSIRACVGLAANMFGTYNSDSFFGVELDTSKNANLRLIHLGSGQVYTYDTNTITIANNDWLHVRIRSLVAGKWGISVSVNQGAWSTERTFGPSGCDNTVTLLATEINPNFYVHPLAASQRMMDIDFWASKYMVLGR